MKTATEKPEPELLNHALIPESEFHRKLAHIFAVPKEELEAHIAANPDEPQKRGRKPKEKE